MLIPFALGSLSGALMLNFFKSLPSNIFLLVILISALLLSIGIFGLANKNNTRQVSIFIIGAMLAFSLACWKAKSRLNWSLPANVVQSAVFIEGKVEGICQTSKEGMRFDVKLRVLQNEKLKKSTQVKIRLFWKNPTSTLAHGDTIQAVVKLKKPWHFANPGGFDQEKQFFIEGIRATGKVLTLQKIATDKSFSIIRMRQDISQKIHRLLAEKPLLGIMEAMTLGISSEITSSQWQTFQGTGTSHMVAISGQQVALVALFCFYVVCFLVRRSQKLTSLYPDKYYGAWAAIVGAFFYSALAGFSIPTQRSLIMIVIAMAALLRGQPIFTWTRLALAWICIALIDPLAPLQLGFWLSFGCVAALIYGHSHYRGRKWRQWVFPQWIVFIALLPISLVFFHQTALYSPLANMLALPVISFIVVPLTFIGLLLLPASMPMAEGILNFAHFSLQGIWTILEKLAALPYHLIQLTSISWPILIVSGLSILLLLAPKGIPGRHFGWIALVPLFLHPVKPIAYGSFRFTLLDVGQGLSAVIQTQHHTLLYDAGPEYGRAGDAGQRVIKPFLKANQIATLDKIVISHSDLDHRGGLKSLSDLVKGEILTSEPLRLRFSAEQCQAGQSWEWDGVVFKMLGPTKLDVKKRNDLSCVLKVSTHTYSVLLSGDIEKNAEKEIRDAYLEELKSTILVVPHHGSLTSSTDNFIQAVSPEYALYPVGKDNHYGFPRSQIMGRYTEKGCKNLISWQTGALTFLLPAGGPLVPPTAYRQQNTRFWFASLAEAG